MLDLLTPIVPTPLRCGTHISKQQPDVEVYAVCLTRIPATKEDFNATRGSRDFVISKFVVLAVGPAGFGRVPYNSKKTTGQKEEVGKPLYQSEDDRVRFYSFEKGKTNKDKGARVDTEDGSACLEAGMVLTFFLREEFWDPSKIDAACSMEVGSAVCLQIASSNVEACAKGYLLKVKRIKHMVSACDVESAFARLPGSEAEFDGLMSKHRAQSPGLKGSLDSSGDLRCFAVKQLGPEACAFQHNGGILICNAQAHDAEGFCDDVYVPMQVVSQKFQVADSTDLLKLLNVALSLQTVGMLVMSSTKNVLMSDDEVDAHPLVALMLTWDVNRFLDLHALAAPDACDFMQAKKAGAMVSGDLTVVVSDDPARHITWQSEHNIYKTERCSWQISFRLSSEEHTGPEDGPVAVCPLSAGCKDTYRRLSVLLAQADKNETPQEILQLELRRVNANKAGAKRKRPVLLAIEDI
jgi:hypothetical protein